jgi:hypothetical protein
VSVLNDILNAVTQIVTNLGLTMNSQTVSVVLRKKAKKEPEPVDPSRQITVSPNESPETWQRYAFGGGNISPSWKAVYKIDVTVVAPNNDDFVGNLSTYSMWRQQIRNSFTQWMTIGNQTPLPTVPAAIDMDVTPDSFLPLSDINSNYDDQRVSVLVTAIETGTS